MNGDIKPLEFMARREDWNFGINLHLRQVTEGMGATVAQPLEFRQYNPGELSSQPFITLDIQAAQQLMDELWQCGLRPTEGTGSAGSLAATQKHLDDMRTIAYKGLNIEVKA